MKAYSVEISNGNVRADVTIFKAADKIDALNQAAVFLRDTVMFKAREICEDDDHCFCLAGQGGLHSPDCLVYFYTCCKCGARRDLNERIYPPKEKN